MALLLWGLVAPDSPHKQRRRFVRATTKALQSLRDGGDGAARLDRFESAAGGALVRLARELNLARPEDQASMRAALALLGAGRELAGLPSPRRASLAVEQCGGALDRIVAAIRDCLKKLSLQDVAAGELRRAAEALGAAMDAFAHQNSPSPSKAEVCSNAG
jgi:uncharacterized membrane protein YccC